MEQVYVCACMCVCASSPSFSQPHMSCAVFTRVYTSLISFHLLTLKYISFYVYVENRGAFSSLSAAADQCIFIVDSFVNIFLN